jgi:hypothetical protein
MPAKEAAGTIEIPRRNRASPRGWQVSTSPRLHRTAHPPRLPLVIMMMGQPGDPDPQYIAKILDAQAQKNKGLAPYVLVVDQLGDPDEGSVRGLGDVRQCGDVRDEGRRRLRPHLPVQQRPHQWVIVGYSNGRCAFKYAAEHPEVWGNLLSDQR